MLPLKLKKPRSFTISYTIGDSHFNKALCDLGASVNLMHFYIIMKLEIREAKPTTISLKLVNRSITYPRRLIEDVLVKVDKFILLSEFIVLDMEEDEEISLILGRSFLAMGKTLINVHECKLILRVRDEEVEFDVLKAMSGNSFLLSDKKS